MGLLCRYDFPTEQQRKGNAGHQAVRHDRAAPQRRLGSH